MGPISRHLLSVIFLTPVTGALIILMVSGARTNAIRWIANAVAAAAFLIAVPLWFLYQPHGKTWQFAERGQAIPAIGASYYVGVDGFSIVLILLTTLMTWAAVLASWDDIRVRVKEFYALMLVMETGILGAFMALDFLLFFLCWEVVLLSMYFLIRTWGGDGRPSSATRFAFYAVGGSVVTLLGILPLYWLNHAVTGAYSFDITQYHTLTVPSGMQRWVFLALFVGFAANVPMVPLHTWLPTAHAGAPTAASVLLAAALLKMGTYGVIRFSLPILPEASRYFVPVVAALAIGGVIYGVVVAFAQTDWKRLVAYSSVSQMAMLMLGIFTLTPVGLAGSIVQQIIHGVSAGAMFLLLGMLSERGRTGEISAYGGLSRIMPMFAAVFVIMSMSSIGLPVLKGFIGQILILQNVSVVHKLWATVVLIGILAGAGCMLWAYRRTMFGALNNPANRSLRDLTARELAIVLPLTALAVWIGLYPAPLLRRLETSVGRVIARVDPASAPFLAQGSDCATPAPPAPAAPPPPAFVLGQPCGDTSGGAPERKAGESR